MENLREQKKHDAEDDAGNLYEYKISKSYSWNFQDISDAVLKKYEDDEPPLWRFGNDFAKSVDKGKEKQQLTTNIQPKANTSQNTSTQGYR